MKAEGSRAADCLSSWRGLSADGAPKVCIVHLLRLLLLHHCFLLQEDWSFEGVGGVLATHTHFAFSAS